jgi:hypothetical protein
MTGRPRPLVAAAVAVLTLVAVGCGGRDEPTKTSPAVAWRDRDAVVRALLVAEILDDRGTAPPMIYVMERLCADAGQVVPSELACGTAIPASGRTALADQLERYAEVRFVSSPDAAADGSSIRDGGLLFWLGPLEDRRDGSVRVGANYTDELKDDRAGAVNLALERDRSSWIVTGAAGLGGCPA